MCYYKYLYTAFMISHTHYDIYYDAYYGKISVMC